MKKKIKDLTLEEVFKLKSNLFCIRECEDCPFNYKKDGTQSELCAIVNEIENNTYAEYFLNQEIEVDLSEEEDFNNGTYKIVSVNESVIEVEDDD